MSILVLAFSVGLLTTSSPMPEQTPSLPKVQKEKRTRSEPPDQWFRNKLVELSNMTHPITPETISKLEKRATELAKEYPSEEGRSHVYLTLAKNASKWALPELVSVARKNATECLKISKDPVQRLEMYRVLDSLVKSSDKTLEQKRLERTDLLLRGYTEGLAQDIPQNEPPELGGFVLPPNLSEEENQKHCLAYSKANLDRSFICDLIKNQGEIVSELRQLYRPRTKGRGNPELREPNRLPELKAAAKEYLTPEQVEELIRRITN
jgi:hypothetical protein